MFNFLNRFSVIFYITSIFGMIGSVAYFIYLWRAGYINITSIIVFVVCLLLFIVSSVMQKKAVLSDYDETGFGKSVNDITKLSRTERRELDKQRLMDRERTISSQALNKMTMNGSKVPEDDLQKLIGLKSVKDTVTQMAARMEFNQKNKLKSLSGHHLVFMGAPGTGKTTVASILTGFLFKYKYIKKNKCLVVDGNIFSGNTANEASEKTTYIIQKAMGGVLFIDEAYAMNQGGQEVIATLIKHMEDDKDKFVVILAGYTDEMKALIEANPGFQSRIRKFIPFPDYTNEEMTQIFMSMANEFNMVLDGSSYDKLQDRFTNERRQKYFGNARTVRNVLDETISRHSLNLKQYVIPDNKKFAIMPEDISVSIENRI
jgi:stage V sporulation protein K